MVFSNQNCAVKFEDCFCMLYKIEFSSNKETLCEF
jgi:hypothetical protein